MLEQDPMISAKTISETEVIRNGQLQSLHASPAQTSVQASTRAKCSFCMDGLSPIHLAEANVLFLRKRITEGNLNEATDIARIAWEQFPGIRESADTMKLIDSIMDGLQQKLNLQVLVPISNTTSAMTTVIDHLQDLARTNPSLIEQGFTRTLEGFKAEMNSIRTAIHEPAARITELNQLVNQLVYKPIARGNAGEAILTDLWIESFTKDQIEKLGGAGREDLLIRPYLGSNGSARFGDAISIERKTGKQRFTGSHREEAIRHAKEKGASIAMLIFDSQDNLPASVKPVSISREQGLLVVVADMQSGSWKMMRETIEVLQIVMDSSNHRIEQINIESIQEVVTELGSLVKLIEQVKGNSAKIRVCADELEQNAVNIKALVKSYQDRLHQAITGAGTSQDRLPHADGNMIQRKEAA
ncbi:MAG: hypothetical protein ACREBU_03025 [Nitrososphaera sp.]